MLLLSRKSRSNSKYRKVLKYILNLDGFVNMDTLKDTLEG